MLVRTEDGRQKDVRVREVTKDNYIVPQNEKHVYHCKIEIERHSQSDGGFLSTPRIQKFGKKEFETVILKNLKLQGYSVEVLYDPTNYLKSVKAMMAQKSGQTGMTKADVDKVVASALAKQKAEFEEKLEETLTKQQKSSRGNKNNKNEQ